MPPVLRSSAPATPDKVALSNSPSRKTPCCQVCHRPRKGHPRQGCPFGDETITADMSSPSAARLTAAMSSMNIALAEEISQPAGAEQIFPILREPQSKAEARRLEGRLMPGTLYPPRDSFFDPPSPPAPTHPIFSSPSSSQKTEVVEFTSHNSALPSQDQMSARSLVRSASMEAREDFLDDISTLSKHKPVSVYTVPADDVLLLIRAARKIGFHAVSVSPERSSASHGALLIIGISDDDVRNLRDRVAATAGSTKGLSFSALVLVAGGALAGAIATIAGLSA